MNFFKFWSVLEGDFTKQKQLEFSLFFRKIGSSKKTCIVACDIVSKISTFLYISTFEIFFLIVLNDSVGNWKVDPVSVEPLNKAELLAKKEADDEAQEMDILTVLELRAIKKFKLKLEVSKPNTGDKERDKVFYNIAKNESVLIQTLQNSWKIRVLARVKPIFKLKYNAFNFKSLFDIYKTNGIEAFLMAKESELREYISLRMSSFLYKMLHRLMRKKSSNK